MRIPLRKSSYTVQNEACVEAGVDDDDRLVFEDSKYALRGETSPRLAVRRGSFSGLRSRILAGELDFKVR